MSLVKKLTSTLREPTEKENNVPKQNSTQSVLLFAILVLAIVLPIRIFIAKPFIVKGASMYPTFNTWHYLIIDQLTYRFQDPQRGDVIVFRYPHDPSRFFIKRIIGLPGETVKLEGTHTTIINSAHKDGLLLQEPYVTKGHAKSDNLTVTLAPEEYFVMGDNRRASSDSRAWGALEESYIVGRAFIRLFPVDSINTFPGKTNYSQIKNQK